MQEIFGNFLVSGNWLQQAFIFFGEGANGKYTLMEVLRAMLGDENTTSLSIKDLSDRFRKVEIMNKLASICDESPTGQALESDVFRCLVGEGKIIAERKYQAPIQFENMPKLIFATNKIPVFTDHSYAFYRRLCIIPYDVTIEKNKRNPNLTKELLEELSGILNWALDGLDRLLSQGYFFLKKREF